MELSNRLKVRALKEGQVKIFKLVNSGKVDPNVLDEKTKQPVAAYNGGGTFMGFFTIYDKYEQDKPKAKKILKNIIGSSIVIKDGKEVLEDVVGNIEFNSKGLCIVKHDEYAKLVCLTRANENKSNPFRNSSIPAVWEEVDAVATQEDILNEMDLVYDAETYAMQCDIKEAVSLASTFKLKHKKDDVREIRMVLRGYAKEFPKEFFRNTKNKEMKMKLSISDAMKLNLIDLTDAQDWIWLEANGTDTKMVSVEAGQDSFAVLIDHLTKNKEDNKKLINALDAIMHQPLEA